MLISTVLSPDILAREHFDDPLYQINVEQLLRGLCSNGIIIVDKDQKLYDKLCKNAIGLSASKHGNQARIWFEEILKKHRQRVVRFVQSTLETDSTLVDTEIVKAVAADCSPDSVLVADDDTETVGGKLSLPICQYIRSPLESKRRAYAEADFDSCDAMADGEFDDLILDACRFTKKLKLYDKILGKANRLSSFREGMERVLAAWTKGAYFSKADLSVEIYTVGHKPSPPDFLSPLLAFERLREQICETLRIKFGIPVSITMKFDRTGRCHPRHLQTDSCTIQFERGFDFIENDGSIRRSFINHAPRGDSHLTQYRNLPNYNFGSRF
jgi:hypothetical protein